MKGKGKKLVDRT